MTNRSIMQQIWLLNGSTYFRAKPIRWARPFDTTRLQKCVRVENAVKYFAPFASFVSFDSLNNSTVLQGPCTIKVVNENVKRKRFARANIHNFVTRLFKNITSEF